MEGKGKMRTFRVWSIYCTYCVLPGHTKCYYSNYDFSHYMPVLSLHLFCLSLSLLCSHCQSVNQQSELDEYVTAAVVVYNIKSPKPEAT